MNNDASFRALRKIITFTLVLVGLAAFAAGCATAGAEPSPQGRTVEEATQANQAAIGVRTERHLNVALLTARQMFEGVGGYQAEQVTIVVCGPAVKSLVAGSGIQSEIERTQQQGDVRVVACGLTVERMGIDPDTLVSSVEVVPNGFIELARLQSLGYQSVEL